MKVTVSYLWDMGAGSLQKNGQPCYGSSAWFELVLLPRWKDGKTVFQLPTAAALDNKPLPLPLLPSLFHSFETHTSSMESPLNYHSCIPGCAFWNLRELMSGFAIGSSLLGWGSGTNDSSMIRTASIWFPARRRKWGTGEKWPLASALEHYEGRGWE